MTFSLAGRCARTGMLGGVITTSSPAVGSRCLFARHGVGVVLTQHRTDPRLGPRGIELLADGCAPPAVIAALVASTPDAGWRQLAVLDATGASAHFSGKEVVSKHAGVSGVDCVAIGNILRDPGVPAAMVAAFEAYPERALAERLLAALQAGDDAGGEERALQSASLMVVNDQSFAYADLRVDLAEQPIAALGRLWQAYAPMADLYVMRAVDPESCARPE